MKKSLIALMGLSLVLGLSACNQGSDSPSESNLPSTPLSSDSVDSGASSDASVEGSSSERGGDIASSSSVSSEEGLPSAWSESDLAAMAFYLNGYTDLPFPKGFTENYVEASGTDSDGECFLVYDTCKDLSSSYALQLQESGFVYDESSSSKEEGYFTYFHDIADSIDEIGVQFYYEQGKFNIFAWIEEGTPSSETFPYDEIAAFLGKETLSASEVPSFALAEGEPYYYYSIEEGYKCFTVFGAIKEGSDENAYVAAYSASLSALGYVVSEKDQVAQSEDFGIEASYMAMDGSFYLLLSPYVKAAEGDHSLSLLPTDFPSGYDGTSLTKEGIAFSYSYVCDAGNVLQFRSAKKGSGWIANSLAFDSLKSIVITAVSTDYYGILSLYVSSSPIDETNPGTKVEPTQSNTVFTYNIPDGSAKYFKLIDEQIYASKNSEIVINYSVA